MKQIVEKLLELEKNITKEKGEFILFALFLREDSPDKWDLVVSAPWLDAGSKSSYEYLAKELKSSLKTQEMLTLSRIVIVDKNDPALDAVHKAVSGEHTLIEVRDSYFFGLQIKHAYIITSMKQNLTPEPEVK